ncbi:hypothetical protein GCM10009566_37910 [Streptomyces murinus]
MPGRCAYPVQVAQPATAATARIPMNTGLILRSPPDRRVVAVVMSGSCAGRKGWAGGLIGRAGRADWSDGLDGRADRRAGRPRPTRGKRLARAVRFLESG